MSIKIAETNMGPSFGQSDIIKGWASIISMSESLNLCLFLHNSYFQFLLGKASKTNWEKAVRLTAWVDPPPPPPPKRSGKCKNFSTSCHIWGYFAIL